MRLFATAMVLALLCASAVAQTPSPAAAVSVTIADEQGKVSVEDTATFDVVVRNEASPSNSPLDDQNRAKVVVTVVNVPAGWTAALDPSSFELKPGQQQLVRLQVSVSADASATTADLAVTAVLTSPLQGLDPILGQVPGGSQSATAQDALRVTRDDSVTRDLLEAVGPWIYAILLLLLAAVLVAVGLSLASRRAMVRLAADTRELTVPPGGRVTFPFQVEGLAKKEDTVLFQVSAVQEGWAAFLPVPDITLRPGDVREMTLVVIAPKGAADGGRQAVLVSATSGKAPKGAANLEFIATVQSGTQLNALRRPKA